MAQKYAIAEEAAEAGLANILSTDTVVCLERRGSRTVCFQGKSKQKFI